jgi:hypothetical protein
MWESAGTEISSQRPPNGKKVRLFYKSSTSSKSPNGTQILENEHKEHKAKHKIEILPGFTSSEAYIAK